MFQYGTCPNQDCEQLAVAVTPWMGLSSVLRKALKPLVPFVIFDSPYGSSETRKPDNYSYQEIYHGYGQISSRPNPTDLGIGQAVDELDKYHSLLKRLKVLRRYFPIYTRAVSFKRQSHYNLNPRSFKNGACSKNVQH